MYLSFHVNKIEQKELTTPGQIIRKCKDCALEWECFKLTYGLACALKSGFPDLRMLTMIQSPWKIIW